VYPTLAIRNGVGSQLSSAAAAQPEIIHPGNMIYTSNWTHTAVTSKTQQRSSEHYLDATAFHYEKDGHTQVIGSYFNLISQQNTNVE